MNAIDEFEAFARMMEVDGQTPETIAKTFGTTVAAVKGRLRYGLSPTGEEAPDAGEITYPASLAEDLKTERAMALGAAMALHPEATLDLTLFKLVSDVLASGMSVTQAIKVEARKEWLFYTDGRVKTYADEKAADCPALHFRGRHAQNRTGQGMQGRLHLVRGGKGYKCRWLAGRGRNLCHGCVRLGHFRGCLPHPIR